MGKIAYHGPFVDDQASENVVTHAFERTGLPKELAGISHHARAYAEDWHLGFANGRWQQSLSCSCVLTVALASCERLGGRRGRAIRVSRSEPARAKGG